MKMIKDMKMIKELTKEQEKQIPIIVEKWYKIFLSTQQSPDQDIIDSVNELYQLLNKSKPQIIILDSPEQCAKYIKDNKLNIYNSIYNSIRSSISNSIMNSISNSIYNSINNSILDSILDSIRNSINNSIYLDCGINILKIKELEQYKSFLNLSEKIFYVTLLEDDIVIISRKLKSIHLDDNDRLHGDGIKAFEFNDGYGSYFNHGINIPEHCGKVKIKNWKAKWLLTESNTTLKRLLIREIGYEKIAKQLNSTIIHKDQNMELLEIPNADIEPIRLLKVICPSTHSVYLLRVPLGIDKCEQARQWTLHNEHEEYEFVKES